MGKLTRSAGLQIVVPYRDANGNWFLDAFTYQGQRLPGFPYVAKGEALNLSPTLYDLDGDGLEEILFTRANHVIALHGDGTLLWSNTVDASSYVPTGGYQTVTNGFYWWPSGVWQDHLPSTAEFYSEVSPLQVLDLAGNGQYEVISAWKIQPDPVDGGQDYNPLIFPIFGVGQWGTMGENWSGGVVNFDAATGRQKSVYHLHQLVESGLSAARLNSAGPLDVCVLNDSDSVVAFDKSRPFGLWGKGMLHKQFGKNQRLMTGSYQVPIDLYAADLDGDGLDEILVAGTQLSSLWQPNETILDDDGGILWRRWLPHLDLTNNSGWLNSASLIPVNPDHDNHIDVLGWNHSYELSFRFWNGVELVDRPGWPKDFYPMFPTPPVVGDVDGDGTEEIVVGTYDLTGLRTAGELRVYGLDGMLKESVAIPGGVKQIPALADIEDVGRLDVICRSLNGELFVWNFGSTSTNLLSWATHRGNMRRDGNRGAPLFPPGTPRVIARSAGYNGVSFTWTNSTAPQLYRVFRAERPEGPFSQIATLVPSAFSYTDNGLKSGCQYVYEVGAVYSTNTVLSAPFALLPLYNGNLIANSGFERDENCRWDKWAGTQGVTNFPASTNVAYAGSRSLQIQLQNARSDSTISQNNQYGIPDSSIPVTPGDFYSFGGFFKTTGFSVPSEHWLEWSSTKTGSDTNTRPALPDPFYYTPHFAAGSGIGDWTYVNRTFQLPLGFPNIELRHRFSAASQCSGSLFLDNVFFRKIPDPAGTNWTTLIPFGGYWRYSTSTPTARWFVPEFDDSLWPIGRAKFGAGTGPTNVVTTLPQLIPNYYFRTHFSVASTNLEELLLGATCTDVSVTQIFPLRVFLNGQQIPSFIDAVSMQGNAIRYFDLVPYISLLRPGMNTVAVQMGNTWSDYDDVAFDVSLKAVAYQSTTPNLGVSNTADGHASLEMSAAAGTVWQLQACRSLSQSNWQSLEVFTNSDGLPKFFVDPFSGSSRFYRLKPF